MSIAAMAVAAVAGGGVRAAAAPPSGAGSFQALARRARPIRAGADLAALFWAPDASCRHKKGFYRRQCEGVRDARAARVRATTYKVAGGSGAVTAGDFDAKRGTLRVVLHACVACAEPISYDGAPAYVVGGKPAHVRHGSGVTAAVLATLKRKFDSADAAAAWKKTALPRLRVNLLVRVPAHPAWRRGGARGFSVKVVGYRVYDPCDGSILFSSPAAKPLAPHAKTCGVKPKPKPKRKPASRLPVELTSEDISSGLAPARAAVKACHKRYGGSGTVVFRITIAGDGHVLAAEAGGHFAGKPVAACIAKAIRKVSFPKTQKARIRVSYPFLLR